MKQLPLELFKFVAFFLGHPVHKEETVVDITLINVILCCTSGDVDVSITSTKSNLLGF